MSTSAKVLRINPRTVVLGLLWPWKSEYQHHVVRPGSTTVGAWHAERPCGFFMGRSQLQHVIIYVMLESSQVQPSRWQEHTRVAHCVGKRILRCRARIVEGSWFSSQKL